MEYIEDIARKLMIIIGIIMFIFGSIGNLFNICVFTIWSRASRQRNPNNNGGRTSNTPLYLLVSSLANLIVILYPLLTRIMFDGFDYRVKPNLVLIICSIRFYVLYTFDAISLACICMATLDRYFVSSRRARLRMLTPTQQRTKQIILLIICFFGIHSIPIIIYYQASDIGQCTIYSQTYSSYYLYVIQISLHGILPICFLSVFGILTYKQLKMIKQQRILHVDKQFSCMLLLMSITIILSSIPYCIEQLYYNIVHDDPNQISSITFLLHVISSLLFYTNPVFSFYVYYISTPNFRRQVSKIIQCNAHNHHFINQINAIGVPSPVCT